MLNDTHSGPTVLETTAHQTLVDNLRNAHALEKQVVAVLESQLKQLDDYPDLHARLTAHITETREQARRLEAGLEACGESASMVKDALLSLMGLGQSSMQGLSDDAVLKAVAADTMTEHLEIATYKTLLVLADMAGKPELRPRLEESLHEEEAMAAWLDENLAPITRRFVEVRAAEAARAAAPPKNETTVPDGEKQQTLWQTLENARTSDTTTAPTNEGTPGRTPDRVTVGSVPAEPRAVDGPAKMNAPGNRPV